MTDKAAPAPAARQVDSAAADLARAALHEALRSSATSGIGVFRAIVEALALPSGAAALDIGCGVLARTSTLGILSDLLPGRVVGLEKHGARITPTGLLPRHVEIHHGEAAYFQPDELFGLICVDLDAEQVFESLSLIVETVPRLLAADGWVVARIPCRSRSGETILRDLPVSSRLAVESFLKENFHTLDPDPGTLLGPLERQGYGPIALVPTRFARPSSGAIERFLPRRWRRRTAPEAEGAYGLPGLRSLSARAWLVLRRPGALFPQS